MKELLYPNARKYLADQVWAMREGALDTIAEILSLRASGVTLTAEEIQARIGAGRSNAARPNGAIQVIPMYGVIDQKIGSMTQISGGTSVDGLMESFRAAMNDDTVRAIILDVDSPGGSVAGIQEAATEIFNARGKKPIWAIANTQIASAAYWLACAADRIICTPSGSVGAIGIISIHDDRSKANEAEGHAYTYITYGQYKGEGNSDGPLSDDARAYKQEQVNTFGAMFTAFVAKARAVPVATVRSSFGQGRMLLAKDALAAGMIDDVATLQEAAQQIQKQSVSAVRAEAPSGEITAEEFSTFGEVVDHALVGLGNTVTSLEGLVDRTTTLTKAKSEKVLALQQSVRDASAKIDELVVRAGIEPTVAATEETTEPAIDSALMLAFEKARLDILSATR